MKYFIDCGTNHGQGLQEFNQKLNFFNNPEWVIHTIEPNPDISPDFSNINNITFHQVAVWDKEDSLTFARNTLPDHVATGYQNEIPDGYGAVASVGAATSCGSRLVAGGIKNQNMAGEILENFVEVPAVDFNKWLRELIPADADKVIVKMDIEGAEFTVLPHMLKCKTFDIIDEIFAETHERFVEGQTAETVESLFSEIRGTNTTVHRWF